MKSRALIAAACLTLACQGPHPGRTPVSGVYSVPAGMTEGFAVWIVDGPKIRSDIYPEFLYGGNPQRYRFIPDKEIWIDGSISCQEFQYTLAHELAERSLMARYGETYADAHDSALAVEHALRLKDLDAARRHEAAGPAVAPTDCDGTKELASLPDSVRLAHVYLVPLATRDNVAVWIVDGAVVRRDVFPDFGLSGNDRAYRFIPPREIWIDAQIACGETGFSIATELRERELMARGIPYDSAYEQAIHDILPLRKKAEEQALRLPAIVVPDPPDRDHGTGEEQSW